MTQAVTTPAKSLGEKLFDARRAVEMTAIPRWSDLMDHEQEAHEKAALAFAASLSHDETANAVITDLRQCLQAAEERAEKVAGAVKRILPHTKYPSEGTLYDARSRLHHIRQIADAALKTGA